MEFRKKVSISGIFAGSIVGVVGRFIVIGVVGVFIGIGLAASGAEVPSNIGYINPLIMSVGFLVSSLFSILGGYIAASIAKHDEMLNGALSSFLAMLFAVCSMSTDPVYLAMITLITSPLFAALGGYLRLNQKERKQSPLSGGKLETDIQRQEAQPEQTAVMRGSKSRGRNGEYYTLIRLGGIAIVVGVIWCLWFGWSLGAFIAPGFLVLLGYGIYRLFRKGKPRPTGEQQ